MESIEASKKNPEDKPTRDVFLENESLVKEFEWKPKDNSEKFDKFLSAQHKRQGTPEIRVIFERGTDVPNIPEMPSEGLCQKNHELEIESDERVKPTCERSMNSGNDCNMLTEEEEDEEALINCLPDELLDYIFTFLSFEERVRTERVCRRWRLLGTEHSWSEPKYLSFDDWEWAQKRQLTDEILAGVLSRCGPVLRSVQLLITESELTASMVNIICNECRNLVTIELRLPNTALPKNCLDKLGECCVKLEAAFLEYDGEEELMFHSFFKNCKILKTLDLSGEKLCPKGHDVEVLNMNLKYLSLNCYSCLEPEFLNKLVKRCNSIETLEMGNFYNYKFISPNLLMKTMLHYCQTLTSLDLTLCREPRMISHLNEFSQLQALVICWAFTAIDYQDRFKFEVASKNLRLFHAFGGVWDLDKRSLQNLLVKNDCLHNLYLSHCKIDPGVFKICQKYTHTMRKIIFECIGTSFKACQWCELFASLHNLERLVLHKCGPGVNNAVAQTLAKSCLKLKVLHIICPFITDKGLLAISFLPCLKDVNLTGLKCISDKGIATLAILGRLEILSISRYPSLVGNFNSKTNRITDDSLCLLARNCPEFRVLYAEGVTNLTNNLATAFCEAIQVGFLKNNVRLYLQGTMVTGEHQKHEKLFVKFGEKFNEEEFGDSGEEEFMENEE